MLIQPIDYFLVVWFVLAAASTLYVAVDQYRNNPEPVVTREPGKWLIHCHIGHHTTNNNAEMDGGGGLMMIIDVQP